MSARKTSFGRLVWRWVAGALAVVIVLMAAIVAAFRVAAPMVPEYRERVEHAAGEAIGVPVRIERMDARWRGLGPELVLDEVRLLSGDAAVPLIRVGRLRLGFSLTRLATGHLEPSRVIFEDAQVGLTPGERGRGSLGGLASAADEAAARDWRPIVARIMADRTFVISDSTIAWRPEPDRTVPFHIRSLRVASEGRSHDIQGEFGLPKGLGGRMTVDGNATGDLREPDTMDWRGNVSLEQASVQRVLTFFGVREHRMAGRVGGEIAATGRGADLRTAEGRIDGNDLRRLEAGPALVSADAAMRRLDVAVPFFRWEQSATGWQIRLNDFSIARGDEEWAPADARLEYSRGEGERRALYGDVSHLRLGDVALLATWLPEEWMAHRDWLAQSRPEGDVTGVIFDLQMDGDRVAGLSGRAKFSGLAMRGHGNWPGFDGLGGEISTSGTTGRVRLASREGTVAFPALFRAPLPVAELDGELEWRKSGNDWVVDIREFSARNEDLGLQAGGTLTFPAEGGAPVTDLSATATDIDAQAMPRYLPVGVMERDLIEWLETSILAARVPGAELTLRGDLSRFPFPEGGGVFDVRFRARDVLLLYGDDWPPATGVTADARFHNASMDIRLVEGFTVGAPVRSARAVVERLDADESRMTIEAEALLGLDQALHFIGASPLEEELGPLFEGVSASGTGDVRLSLDIPLSDVDATRVDGTVTIADGRFEHPQLPVAADAANGVVAFTEKGVSANNLTARLDEYPVRVDIGPDADHDERPVTNVRVTAGLGIRDLDRWLDSPLHTGVSGRTEVSAVFDLHHGDGGGVREVEARLESDLRGIAIAAPPPLGKKAAAVRNLRVNLEQPSPEAFRALVNLGGDVRADARARRDEAGEWHFAGARVHLGGEPPPGGPAGDGVIVSGYLDEARLSDWLEAGDRLIDPETPDAIDELDLRVGRLLVGPFELRDQAVLAERTRDAWEVRLVGDQAAGSVRIPRELEGADPIVVAMDRLRPDLPESDEVPEGERDGSQPSRDLMPRDIPRVSARINDFAIGKREYGSLTMALDRTGTHVYLRRLLIRGGSFTIDAAGEWIRTTDVNRGRLTGAATSTSVAATMTSLNYQGGLTGSRGRVTADLQWAGSPGADIMERLTGEMTVRLDNGQILDVEPGAGRVFGLLSLNALPRRLFLDFRDIFGEGLQYDRIRGDFVIDSGSAYTNNLKLDGPLADILLVGRVNFVDKRYDQTAFVDTSLLSSLPVAGALAGGTGVGATLLVLSEMLEKPLRQVTRVQYRITGPWADPVVERIDRNQPDEADRDVDQP